MNVCAGSMNMNRLINIQLISNLFFIVFAKQLPDNVIPQDYRLEIITNIGDEDDNSFNFKGSVLIHVKCVTSTDDIILHSKNLKIDEGNTVLRTLNETQDTPTISKISQDTENDFLILQLSKSLNVDFHYEVELRFEGDLEEDKVGYCKNPYFDEVGNENWIAVTYFKPNNARRAFPCFDEPNFKANFTVILGRSIKFKSVSNMPLLKTQEMENKRHWEWDHYRTTPRMSTYVLGFAIIDFNYKAFELDEVQGGLTIWAKTPDPVVHTFAIGMATSIMSASQKYFTVKFPIPKLDVIVIRDRSGIAPVIETWGLIVLQDYYEIENVFVVVAGEMTARVIADQMVHQWFGNLVTIKSWTESWLIEGFSKYLSIVFIEQFLPEWELLNGETTADFISIFDLDCLRNTEAISIPSNQFSNTTTFSYPISREKAFLIIRMMSHFLGSENLRSAIHHFLETYQYSNAGSEELIKSIRSSFLPGNVDIKTVMDTWFLQPGVPLVTVTRNYRRGTLEIKQERFFRDRELLGNDTTKWWIPLTYTTECELDFHKTTAKKWLSPDTESISIESPLSPADWVIFNTDASGLYIVNYDEKNWNLIIDFLSRSSFESIPPLNRVLLIESAANLAWIGRLHYRIFLDMNKYLVQERDFNVWNVALHSINDLEVLLRKMPVYGKFLNYVRQIITEIYKQYGLMYIYGQSTDPYPQLVHHKIQVFDAACSYEVEHCVSGVLYRFYQHHIRKDVSKSVVADVREIFFCTAIKHSTDEEWHYSWNEYRETNETMARNSLLHALGCSKNETLLRIFLERSLNEKYVRKEDITTIIVSVAENGHVHGLITEFLSKNIETIHDRISPDVQKLTEVLIAIARYIVTDEELSWLTNFIENNQKYFRDIENGVTQALEIAKLSVQWHHKNYDTIEAYFKDYKEDK